jgi:hypothetical protein
VPYIVFINEFCTLPYERHVKTFPGASVTDGQASKPLEAEFTSKPQKKDLSVQMLPYHDFRNT